MVFWCFSRFKERISRFSPRNWRGGICTAKFTDWKKARDGFGPELLCYLTSLGAFPVGDGRPRCSASQASATLPPGSGADGLNDGTEFTANSHFRIGFDFNADKKFLARWMYRGIL